MNIKTYINVIQAYMDKEYNRRYDDICYGLMVDKIGRVSVNECMPRCLLMIRKYMSRCCEKDGETGIIVELTMWNLRHRDEKKYIKEVNDLLYMMTGSKRYKLIMGYKDLGNPYHVIEYKCDHLPRKCIEKFYTVLKLKGFI